MSVALNAVLVVIGVWLLSYRAFMRTRCRFWVQLFAQLSCACTVVSLNPLATSVPPQFRIPAFMLGGAIFGMCANCCTPTIGTFSFGSFIGALLWQMAFSKSVPEIRLYLILLTPVLLSLFFCLTPLGAKLFERFLLPAVGASVLSSGVIGFVSVLGGCDPEVLVGAVPCTDAGGEPLVNIGIWLALFLYGVLFQKMFTKAAPEPEDETRNGNLVASLLPGAGRDGLLPRPTDSKTDSRFPILIQAMYADEGADQSHLSEDERKLVDACRADEFERDRVMWGGGLI
eukprot:TRINITY_DN67519_c0_g1_i1.p1 TRINITY_DN67519_c0_g1~~TRINITY_DN67519_c0_g1_i1.p1  ORF type:complete len:286 (+),score=30.32 TRINITY_DN67519_c0_g1_i1:80-937(+)